MKTTLLTFIATMALLAALAIPGVLAAQDNATTIGLVQHHHYQLVDVGTFGVPQSFVQVDSGVLNNHGVLVGWADTSTAGSPEFCFYPGDGFASHAFRWMDGTLTDLGTLAGGNSSQAVWVASNGLIAGYSQNGQIDPLVGYPESRAVLWRHGQAIDLGTLGGNESIAYAVNNRGQVVGTALNTVPDPYSFFDFVFCGSSNGTQTRAFLWDRNNGMQDLGTLGTGDDALAFFVNDAGQVAGFSYTNTTPNPTTGLPTFDPFLWEPGKGMRDLGTFGGTEVWQMGRLNERGQVVGSLTLPGDTTFHPFLWDGKQLIDLGTLGGDMGYGNWVNDAAEVVGQAALPEDQTFHAFLWRDGVMTDLGVLPGDSFSDTSAINARGQVVGLSGNPNSTSAVLWENSQVYDLNALVDPGSGLTLGWALYINDDGEISAFGADSSGNNHDVLLIPCDEHHLGLEGCDYSMVQGLSNPSNPPWNIRSSHPQNQVVPRASLPPNSMQHRFGNRLGPWSRSFSPAKPASNGASTMPPPSSKDSGSSEPILDLNKIDHTLEPFCYFNCARGFCQLVETSQGWETDGECYAYLGPACIAAGSSVCSPGQRGIHREDSGCGLLLPVYIDRLRPCTVHY